MCVYIFVVVYAVNLVWSVVLFLYVYISVSVKIKLMRATADRPANEITADYIISILDCLSVSTLYIALAIYTAR